MANMGFQTQPFPPRLSETEAEREQRIQREAAIIARAEADIDAGLGIDYDALEHGPDDLEQDEDTPLPGNSHDRGLAHR